MNRTIDSAIGRLTADGVMKTATSAAVQAARFTLSYPTPQRPMAASRSTPTKEAGVTSGLSEITAS